MSDEFVFSGNDLKLIESLVYDPSLEPSYEFLKGCLVWEDERPSGLTPDAYDILCDLWIARSLLHRGLSLADHPLDPQYCEDIWQRALKQGFSWPGFNRLILNDKDKLYYESQLLSAQGAEDY